MNRSNFIKVFALAAMSAPMILLGQTMVEVHRCGAETKSKTVCQARVKVMGEKCFRHDPNYVKPAETTSVTCKGTTKAGLPCALKTKHTSGFCHHHREQN